MSLTETSTRRPYKKVWSNTLSAVKLGEDPVILFRKDLTNEEELKAAEEHFDVYLNRAAVPVGKKVIGRYSVLPYYQELVKDLNEFGGSLINTWDQHNFVADMQEWYPVLEGMTPKTWFSVEEIPPTEMGPFVVKGRTNSRKHDWNRMMFAEDRSKLGLIIANLMDNPLISQQGLVIRKYEPLEKILDGINGLPITMEFRVFILYGYIVGHAFYWSSYSLDVKEKLGKIPNLTDMNSFRSVKFIMDCVKKIEEHKNAPNFYVIDVARTISRELVVIELNDGQMSGLSEIDPSLFYHSLKQITDIPGIIKLEVK